MKLIMIPIILAVILSACGKDANTSTNNTANSKNTNSSNASNSSSESNKNAAETKDMTPPTMSETDIVGNYDENKEVQTHRRSVGQNGTQFFIDSERRRLCILLLRRL